MKHDGTENEIEFSALYDEEMIMKKTKLTVIVDNIPQGDIKGNQHFVYRNLHLLFLLFFQQPTFL